MKNFLKIFEFHTLLFIWEDWYQERDSIQIYSIIYRCRIYIQIFW